MIELLENGSTSTPLRGGLVPGNTLGTLDLAPAIAPLRDKKISKECNKMLDSWFARVHNTCILNNKSEDLYNESNR